MQQPKEGTPGNSQLLYHKMIEEVEDYAILLLSIEGNIENWNKGAEKIKGYMPEEIVGKNFRLFYTADDRIQLKPDKLLNEATRTGKATEEGWRLRKDGTTFWGSIVITALHDETGEVIGFSKVTRDLTERKLAEDKLRQHARQLERQNKELEQFAYIASHDLQEPLRTVSAFIELLKKNHQHQLDGNAQQYLRYVSDASDRMRDLITGLLEFSRIGREHTLEEVDCQQLLNEVIQDLQASIQETNATIKLGDLPKMGAYRVELKLLFQNLVSNALKFSREGVPPQILVNAQQRFAGWEFSVSDNGIGIDPKFYDKIFIIFQRLNNRRDYSGTGIGLAYCKKIVELHGGDIWLHSKLNEGTTFYLYLPDKRI